MLDYSSQRVIEVKTGDGSLHLIHPDDIAYIRYNKEEKTFTYERPVTSYDSDSDKTITHYYESVTLEDVVYYDIVTYQGND